MSICDINVRGSWLRSVLTLAGDVCDRVVVVAKELKLMLCMQFAAKLIPGGGCGFLVSKSIDCGACLAKFTPD